MALASNSLTTVASVKTYMGVSSSTDDTLIETIINNVSDQIERWCDRKLVQTDVTEFIDAQATRTLALENSPVISVDLISYGARDSIVVSSSDSTDLLLTVAVEEDQIRIVRIASDGTQTVANFPFSGYASTSLLAAIMNASTGVNATSSYNAPSFTLHRMGGRNVLDASAYLTVTTDDENEYRVDYERGLVHLRADAFPRYAESDSQTGSLTHSKAFSSSTPADMQQFQTHWSKQPSSLCQMHTEDVTETGQSIKRASVTTATRSDRGQSGRIMLGL